MHSRRDFLKIAGGACLASPTSYLSPLLTMDSEGHLAAMRCANIVNFIRGVEPRFATDLLLPVQKQMELIRVHNLPATWLLQYDALVAGPFVQFLKDRMAKDHEVGFWFEMNEMLCRAADVEWRGRPGYEWDHLPPVAFTIGYTPEERIKLADTAMREFKSRWGHFPKSVASWNLDSITMAHLTRHYGIDAYAVCRDQIATDGFTIWGAPIAGYYPSKLNCWSPAVDRKNQINTPVFRMLGQDPVYYYQRQFTLPDGKVISEPDTMEPVWTSGRSLHFVQSFLTMISEVPCQQFAYAQLGQENSFPWAQMEPGYAPQMKALAELRSRGLVHVETMGESGRRFKRGLTITPSQAQVMLTDPFQNTDPAETTVWYQSRFYRANLHFHGDLPFLRDLTIYDDRNAQPYLKKATRLNDVEQRMPAILDGYHWATEHPAKGEPGAGGFIVLNGQRIRLSGKPVVREDAKGLSVDLPTMGGVVVEVRFEDSQVSLRVRAKTQVKLALAFEWDPTRAALTSVESGRAHYRWQDFDYSIKIARGNARSTSKGWTADGEKGEIVLKAGG